MHMDCEGVNGVEGKSKQALKRARAKARKAAAAAMAGENVDANSSPMLSRSQSGASSDASQPLFAHASPHHEVRQLVRLFTMTCSVGTLTIRASAKCT